MPVLHSMAVVTGTTITRTVGVLDTHEENYTEYLLQQPDVNTKGKLLKSRPRVYKCVTFNLASAANWLMGIRIFWSPPWLLTPLFTGRQDGGLSAREVSPGREYDDEC